MSKIVQINVPKMVRYLLGVEQDVGRIKGIIGFYLNDDGEIVVRLEE